MSPGVLRRTLSTLDEQPRQVIPPTYHVTVCFSLMTEKLPRALAPFQARLEWKNGVAPTSAAVP